jgi:hypothetical protein
MSGTIVGKNRLCSAKTLDETRWPHHTRQSASPAPSRVSPPWATPEVTRIPRPRPSPRLPRPGRCRRRRWRHPTRPTMEGSGSGTYDDAFEREGAAAGGLSAAEEATKRRDAGRLRLGGNDTGLVWA